MITGLRIVTDNDGLAKVRPMGFDIRQRMECELVFLSLI